MAKKSWCTKSWCFHPPECHQGIVPSFYRRRVQERISWNETQMECSIFWLLHHKHPSWHSFNYLVEIIWGQHGVGKYHTHSQYGNRVNAQPLPDKAIYSPDEIIQRIKGNLHEPTEGNTVTVAETGHELELPKKQLSQREWAQQLIHDLTRTYTLLLF